MAQTLSQLKLKKEQVVEKKQDFLLTVDDRCDSCGSQAFVWVQGSTGDLLFCGHHYTKILSDSNGYIAMMNFAEEVVDERDRLQVYERQRKAI